MLDLNALAQKPTQGQPSAEMVLAAPRPPDRPTRPAGSSSTATPSAARPAAAAADPRAVAREVYRLLRQDLAIRRQRRGGRG